MGKIWNMGKKFGIGNIGLKKFGFGNITLKKFGIGDMTLKKFGMRDMSNPNKPPIEVYVTSCHKDVT